MKLCGWSSQRTLLNRFQSHHRSIAVAGPNILITIYEASDAKYNRAKPENRIQKKRTILYVVVHTIVATRRSQLYFRSIAISFVFPRFFFQNTILGGSIVSVSLNSFYGLADYHSAGDRIVCVGEQIICLFASSTSSFAIPVNVIRPRRFHIHIPTSLSSFLHLTKSFYASLCSSYTPARGR